MMLWSVWLALVLCIGSVAAALVVGDGKGDLVLALGTSAVSVAVLSLGERIG